jgi:hypothetical protein
VHDFAGIKKRFSVCRFLDERSWHLPAGAESLVLGRGGISAVARIRGLSRPMIRQGVAELKSRRPVRSGRVRRPGADASGSVSEIRPW